jgi:ATP-dependent RNA helicase RhlE
MLDMGFLPDIRKIIARLPRKRQSLFFSATMEKPVVELANTLVKDPVHIAIEPEKPAVDRITQRVLFVEKGDKVKVLIRLMEGEHLERVIIFTQMKHVANRVQQKLTDEGIRCASIHGNKSQSARTNALRDFKNGRIRALVATDIAARGIDVDGISHVINYDMPQEAETYVHRIGRTARAGADGDAISLCSPRERDQLRAIETLIRLGIPRDVDHPHHSERSLNATGPDAKPLPRGGNPRGGGKPAQQRSRPAARRPAGRGRKGGKPGRRRRPAGRPA